MIWQKHLQNGATAWKRTAAATGLATVLLATVLLAMGCAGPATVASDVVAPLPDDVDAKVVHLRRQLAEHPGSPEAATWQEQLQAAKNTAELAHVDAANRYVNAHDLAAAEAELVLASSYDAIDTRLMATRGRVAELRGRCAMLQGQVRGLLMRLDGKSYAAKDAALYAQLLDSVEFLLGWQKDYPAAAELRDRAAPLIAAWKSAEARAEWQAGNAEAAQARLAEAEHWKADHPDVALARQEQQKNGALAADRAAVKALLGAGDHGAALQRADAALLAHPGDEELLAMRRKAARAVIDSQVAAAVGDLGAGRWQEAAQKVAEARHIAGADADLQKGLEATASAVQKPVLAALGKKAAAAKGKGYAGSVWWYGQLTAAVLGSEAKRDAAQAKLTAILTESAHYHLTTRVAPLDKPVAGALHAGVPEQVVQATAAAVVRQIGTLGPAGETVTTAKGKQTDGVLQVAWPKLIIERSQSQQQRTKEFLDHTEPVDNPEWGLAQSKMSAELAKLNAATDDARPLRDAANMAESKLFQLQGQLADVKKKMVEEDRVTYAKTPSPCPDGKLDCPQTKAQLRWKANVEYYDRRIAEESAKLATLAPRLRVAQETEDAAQKRFDGARDVAEKTSRKMPQPVNLPYSYAVTLHRLKVAAQLKLALVEGAVKGAAPRAETNRGLDEVSEDFTSDTVMIKGQVLEAQHAAALPDDASVTAGLARRLVEPALQPVLEALSHHATRFVAKAEASKTADEKGHWLALAWLSRAALSEGDRKKVAAQLVEQYGYDPETGALRLSVLVPPAPAATKPSK